MITEETIQNKLMELVTGWQGVEMRTIEQAHIMTYNKGLVFNLPDGREFVLTINQTR